MITNATKATISIYILVNPRNHQWLPSFNSNIAITVSISISISAMHLETIRVNFFW